MPDQVGHDNRELSYPRMRVSMTPKPQMPDQVGHDNRELSYPRMRVSIPKTMPYTVTPTHIPDLLILEPKALGDARAQHACWFGGGTCIALVLVNTVSRLRQK